MAFQSGGPMMQMANAKGNQAVDVSQQKLRDVLENNETATLSSNRRVL